MRQISSALDGTAYRLLFEPCGSQSHHEGLSDNPEPLLKGDSDRAAFHAHATVDVLTGRTSDFKEAASALFLVF